MDYEKMLQELRAEREAIEEAIVTLERIARSHIKRRGRPPAWLSEMQEKAGKTPERPAKRSAAHTPSKPERD